MNTFAAAAAIAIGILVPAYSIGRIGSKAVESMARQPEIASKIQLSMILACAFCEGLGIFSFVVAFLITNK
mgnify:CR=1 FL=1